MKADSTALAGQRETRCYEKKERIDTDLEFSSGFPMVGSNVLVLWFRLHRFVSGVRLLFEAQPKIGSATLDYLQIVLFSSQCCFYLVTSPSLQTFKPESSHYFLLVSKGGHISFWWFHTCKEDLRPPFLFLVIFNYRSHSLWRADPQRVLWPDSPGVSWPFWRLCVCFFSLFIFPFLSSSLFNFDAPYHVTPLWFRVDLGVIAMKGYSSFPKAPGLEPHHQLQFTLIPRTLVIFDS